MPHLRVPKWCITAVLAYRMPREMTDTAMKKLLIALKDGTLHEAEVARIRELAPDHEVVISTDVDEIGQVLQDVEIAFGNFPRKLLQDAEALKWYQQWSAGADWLLQHPEIAAKDFILTNTSGVHAIPIAEHVLAFMLAFARGFPEAARNQAASQWPVRPPEVFELAGKTMLLVGVGRIGEQTGKAAKALGMKVTGVRRSSSVVPDGVDEVGSLDDLLPEADFVVLTVPLTNDTRNMFGEAEFRAMKETAYLINIGRGGTVDEAALATALMDGVIRGAGLDVFAEEPLAVDSALWSMDNVIVTSHYSGDTPLYARRSFDIFIDNLERFQSGRKLRNVVDKQTGY